MSAALEPGTPTLAARLERLAQHGRPRYTVLGEVAQGGMGRILRAWDERLAREVAMKVVPRAALPGSNEDQRTDHERRLARFLDEARITGQLDHPGIVPVYEIGLDDEGRVFFTMPLVRGRDLKSVFALVHRGEDGWTLQRAVEVMQRVCLTVAFAHQKGVVHRDLKPENVMVGPYGEAYVMDWGLALLLGRTEKGGIVGTPAYMSPEQAAGRSAEVGPRSDVYSLGAMLYELFARRMPHELSLETRADEHAAFEKVLATPPRPLSELGAHGEGVPPELAAICAKAMERDPAARYASALEMADDLAAWLSGRVVRAHAVGRWTRLRLWRARNRALALALDALAALFLVACAALAWQKRLYYGELQAKHDEVRVSAYAAGLSAADLGLRAHETGEARRRLKACDPELRGWEWRHLALRADSSTRVLDDHQGPVRSVAVSPDGRLLASGSDDGTVKLWDAESGALRTTLVGHSDVVTVVAFAPDGTRLASGSRDDGVFLWDVWSGVLERELARHPSDVTTLAFSPDGAVLASGDLDGGLYLSGVSDGRELARRPPQERDGLVDLDYVPCTGEIAAAHLSGYVRLLGPEELELRRESRVALSTPTSLAADPRGDRLAIAYDRTVYLVDASTLHTLRTLPGHARRVSCVAFSPDGRRLATASFDKVLRAWELETGRALEFEGHGSDMNSVAFFPDGQRLVTGAEDDSLRLWDLARASETVLAEHEWMNALAFAPDGQRLAVGAQDRTLRLLELESGRELASLAASGSVDCVAWSTRNELAFGCGEPAARVLTAGDLAPVRALEAGLGFPRTLVFDARGARLFVRDSKGQIGVHDLAGGRPRAVLEVSGDESSSLALSHDGRLLAAGTAQGEVWVWDARTLARRATWHTGEAAITVLAFAPDGALLAVGRRNRIALLSTRDGRLQRTLDGHENLVSCLVFSPDGKRLVSGSYDHTLRVWDPSNDESLLTLHGHAEPVTSAAFDPGGEVLASTSKDGSLRLWRTARAFETSPTVAVRAPASRADPK